MNRFETVCLDCEAPQSDPAAVACAVCRGPLGFRYDDRQVRWDDRFRNSMWRYRQLLPIADSDRLVSLGEGGTPLLRSRHYQDHQVYLKDETRNPTGSHKDRPLAVAINHAASLGIGVSIVVSGGSTGISNAALAARAGMHSVVVMTEDTPVERAYPVFALGSSVIRVSGELDPVIDAVIAACHDQGLYLSATARRANPYQSEGSKTIAYEIVEELGYAPDWLVVPVGGGGTIAGIWRGFKDLQRLDRIPSLPRLVGVVPRAYNALEVAFERGLSSQADLLELPYEDLPPSVLVKLAHAYPPDGAEALEAVRESRGRFMSVTDEEALAAQGRVGRHEGLYVEPSTSACLPVIDRLLSADIGPADTLVALMCGSGFRENFLALKQRPLESRSTTPEGLSALLAATVANQPG